MKENIKSQDVSIEAFEKLFGHNIINFADQVEQNLAVMSSGSIQLNQALGIGGYPIGRIIEIYGNESSGKTTLALLAVKEAQLLGKRCLYIDAENALDIKYVKSIGIDTNKLLIAHPLNGEQAFDIMEMLIKNKQIDFLVVDSVAAMLPNVEKESSIDEQQMGLHARLMSKGLRRIQSLLLEHECTIIFLNQIREKIGVFFGNPEVTTGGRALKFFTSIRIEIRKNDLIKDSNNKIGIQSKITVTKNKLAPPLKQAFIELYFDSGFNEQNEIIDFAVQYEVIQKSGSWYSFRETKIAQGKEQLRKVLKEDATLYQEIKNITLDKIK